MSLFERYGLIGILLIGVFFYGLEQKLHAWWTHGHSLSLGKHPFGTSGIGIKVEAFFRGSESYFLWGIGIFGFLFLCMVICRWFMRIQRARHLVAMEIILSRDDVADPHQIAGFLDAVYNKLRARYSIVRWILGQDHLVFEIARGADGVVRYFLIAPKNQIHGIASRLQGTYTNVTFETVKLRKRSWPIRYHMKLEKNPYVFTIQTVKDYRLSVIEDMAASWSGLSGEACVQYVLYPRPLFDTDRLRDHQSEYESRHLAMKVEDPAHPGVGYLQDKDLKGSMEQLGKGIFRVELRIGSDSIPLAKGAIAAFGEAASSNRLVENRIFLRKWLFEHFLNERMPGILFFKGCILSTAHVATIFHLPSVRLRGVHFRRNQVRRGVASHSILRDEKQAVVVDEAGAVAVHDSDRKFGVLLLGTQGTGKSTTMLNFIRTDARNLDKAICIIDPKNDLAEDALSMIPKDREVVYLNVADPDNRVVINPFLNPVSKTVLVSNLMSALSQQFGGDSIGPRSDAFLRNAMYAILDTMPKDADIFQVYRMLSDADFREMISGRLTDDFGRMYWTKTFAAMAENPKFLEEALAAPRNKLERLLSVDLIKRVLVGNQSLDLRELIDRRGILVVNLAKGLIGEDNAALLGNFLLSAIWQAIQGQAMKPKEERVPVALFCDEVHNFANPAFEKMLSEGRGFGLQACVAMQFLGQITDKKIRQAFESLLQNLFVYRTEQLEDAEYLAKVFMRVYGNQIQVSDVVQDRLNFGPDDMMNLPIYTAIIRLVAKGEMQPAFLARTIDTKPYANLEWSFHHRNQTTLLFGQKETGFDGLANTDGIDSENIDSKIVVADEGFEGKENEQLVNEQKVTSDFWTRISEDLHSLDKVDEIKAIAESLQATEEQVKLAVETMLQSDRYHPTQVRNPVNTFRMILRKQSSKGGET